MLGPAVGATAAYERSVAGAPERLSTPDRPEPGALPRDAFAYIEVKTPSMAERLPTRVVPPPRLMRATAAAQDAFELTDDVPFFKFAKLIDSKLPRRPVRYGDPSRMSMPIPSLVEAAPDYEMSGRLRSPYRHIVPRRSAPRGSHSSLENPGFPTRT
jgi:hypothetical protein